MPEKDNNPRLLRPLHRQRTHRRHKSKIMNGDELSRYFKISRETLESYLATEQIAFHKDSRGEIWVSLSDQ